MVTGGAASAQRWRRYGKDRLYVTAADGVKLGWRDLQTGEDHLEGAERVGEYVTAVVAWLATNGGSVPSGEGQPAAVPEQRASAVVPDPLTAEVPPDVRSEPTGPAEPAWEDLATRSAGMMAREHAVALRQAAPVRTFLARARGVHTTERAWRIGADGEEMVAEQLARLVRQDARWRLLNAIAVGEHGSDIDHIVVGPGGVFTLNTKHHPRARIWVAPNTFLVNGQRQPYIRNSRHEAERAARLLSAAAGCQIAVTGVVVVVGAASFEVKEPPTGVQVITRMALRGWLRKRPATLTDEQIDGIYEVARRSTTWQPLSRKLTTRSVGDECGERRAPARRTPR